MKKKFLLIGILLVGFLVNAECMVCCQNFAGVGIYENGKSFPHVSKKQFIFKKGKTNASPNFSREEVDDHYLGNKVANKVHLLKDIYVFRGALRVSIEKPVIYKSILKIDRYMVKQVKKGNIKKAFAESQLIRFIDIAIAIFPQSTYSFEKALKKAKSPEELIDIYNSVEFK